MRYWFLRLHIRHGEYEFYSKTVLTTQDDKDFDAEQYAKSFYLGDDEGEDTFDDKTYFFNAGEVAVKVSLVAEITKEEFDVMARYL